MGPSEFDLGKLHAHCEFKGITIHSSIQPKHVPGCGLGVYAIRQIGAGERLIHIPISQVFTTANIPNDFLDKSAREGIAVHAQLAAFFAFGKKADLEPYRPWMKTWPAFGDFFTTMPMFWGDMLKDELEKQHVDSDEEDSDLERARPVAKKQKTHNDAGDSNSQKPKALASSGGPPWVSKIRSLGTIRDQVIQMVEKLVSHIISIHHALPKLKLLKTPRKITRFFYAWCLINTRCFYYVPRTSSGTKHKNSKPKAPADPNEAMALCPFMDFFNHTAPSSPGLSNVNVGLSQKPCKVKSEVTGFIATTASDIQADTEILFSYGLHTNDTLWSEYGFLLPGSSNTCDSFLLDSTVLEDLSDEQQSVLDGSGYLGTYTLFNDGSVCYRTEMAAWLPVLGTQKWTKAVEEGIDPADLAEAGMQLPLQGKHNEARKTRSRSVMNARQQHCQIIEGWLKAVQEQARKEILDLKRVGKNELLETYKTLSIMESSPRLSEEARVSLAGSRRRMCIDRCEQISGMAARGVEAVSADVAGEP